MRGKRKLYVFSVAIGALLAGFGVCALVPSITPAFASFVTGIGAVTAAAMAGNVGEHFALRKPVDPAEGK